MLLLTEDAILVCKHRLGKIDLDPRQALVTIAGRRVLVKPDPEHRPIKGCPMYGPAIKPCSETFEVKEGYSEFIRIQGQPVCLDAVTGLTNGSPSGGVRYVVDAAGQGFVKEDR